VAKTLSKGLGSSLVGLLVVAPLCMGIAIATCGPVRSWLSRCTPETPSKNPKDQQQ
jgi:hypothetical protein